MDYARQEQGTRGKIVWGNGATGTRTPERSGLPASDLLKVILRALHRDREVPCLILHGPIASGKTSTAAHLARGLASAGISVGGILAPRLVEAGRTAGYAVEDLRTGERRPLASLYPPGVPAGRYFLADGALGFARDAVMRALDAVEVVFIDEVGRLELHGGGHAPGIAAALRREVLPVLLVRSSLIGRALSRFGIAHALVLAANRPPDGPLARDGAV